MCKSDLEATILVSAQETVERFSYAFCNLRRPDEKLTVSMALEAVTHVPTGGNRYSLTCVCES
jgi:hypothetical protein